MADVDVRGIIGHRTANLARMQVDGSNQRSYPRLDALQELVTPNPYNGLQQPAVEGSYYWFTQEGTRNTGVQLGNTTGVTYSSTQALLVVANNNALGGPDVVLDYLTVKIDAAGTAGTYWYWYYALDNLDRSAGATGNNAILTAHNADNAPPPGVVIMAANGGSITTPAAGGKAYDVGHNVVLNGVGGVNMFLTVLFGAQERPAGTVTLPTTTAGSSATQYAPPIVVRPGWSFVLNEFQTSRTAAITGELFGGVIVR